MAQPIKYIKIFKLKIKNYIYILSIIPTLLSNDTGKKKVESFETWCRRHMERISWIERKTNEEVLRSVKEKHTFMDVIRARRWKTVGHPEELHI